MKNPSATYRFFCAFAALTLILSVVTPASLSALGMAGHCDMNAMEHSNSHTSHSEQCEMASKHNAKHHHAPADSEDNSPECDLNFNCACSMDSHTAQAQAISAVSKIFAGLSLVSTQSLGFPADPDIKDPPEPVFASLYSPPIFLKNSSFLN